MATDISAFGFDQLLQHAATTTVNPTVYNTVTGGVQPQTIFAGPLPNILFHGKQTFSDTASGYRWGLDGTDGGYKWTIGGSGSRIDWNVTTTNALTIRGNNASGPIFQTINEAVSAIHVEQYTADNTASNITFRKARGSQSAPSAVSADDSLGFVAANGYGSTAFPSFGTFRAAITFAAAEGWTDAAQGTYIDFSTTPTGSTTRSVRIRIAASGNVSLGSGTNPATSALLDLSSTTGSLLVPRMTTTQRDALTGTNGMIIYNTTANQMQGFINGAWAAM